MSERGSERERERERENNDELKKLTVQSNGCRGLIVIVEIVNYVYFTNKTYLILHFECERGRKGREEFVKTLHSHVLHYKTVTHPFCLCFFDRKEKNDEDQVYCREHTECLCSQQLI